MTWPSDFWRVGDAAASHLADWLAGRMGGGQAYKATSADEDYDVIRADFTDRLKDAFLSFVSTNGRAARNDARRAVAEDIPAAFYRGYKDAGGDETEDDDESWLTAKQAEQLGFMNDALAALKAQGDDITEGAIDSRVEVWAGTLDSVYAQGKLRGAANKMLTWRLGDTEQHCRTCSKLDGQRHSAKWWQAHDYIPREPGSDTLDCKGYNCDCRLEDDKGDEFTVEQ